MKVHYDAETDSLTITLREDKIKESDEIQPGVIIDLGFDDNIVGLEILQASDVVSNVRQLEFTVTETDGSIGARRRQPVGNPEQVQGTE